MVQGNPTVYLLDCMTTADEHAIGVFERKIPRVIFGPKKKGDLFKCRSNSEVYQLFREADIVKRIEINRLRWAGHVVRRPIEATINKWAATELMEKSCR